jgi:hypothetical protein
MYVILEPSVCVVVRVWPGCRVPGLFEKEGVSMRGFLLVVLAAVTAVTAALGMLGEPGERAVQIVYESDTRGYYLPCG